MGNCCLDHHNSKTHYPLEPLEFSAIHHNPQKPYATTQQTQPTLQTQTVDKSEMISLSHEPDPTIIHQTTNYSITISKQQKSNSTVSTQKTDSPNRKEQVSTASISISATTSNQPISQAQSKQLNLKRQQFLNSKRLFHALNKSIDVFKMLEAASQAKILCLSLQEKSIYMRSISHVEALKNKYSRQSIEEVKAYIYTQLTCIAAKEGNEIEGDTFVLRAIQAYKNTVSLNTIEQYITLLNNYAVFKISREKLQQAKKYLLDAIGLMTKYYTVQDDRKYMGLLNLACLYYQTNQQQSASEIIGRIEKQCRNGEIVKLATTNQMQYTKLL